MGIFFSTMWENAFCLFNIYYKRFPWTISVQDVTHFSAKNDRIIRETSTSSEPNNAKFLAMWKLEMVLMMGAKTEFG